MQAVAMSKKLKKRFACVFAVGLVFPFIGR